MTNRIFMDAEFIEGSQPRKLFGITTGQSKPTIDLISIGMVNEKGQEYYAVSKDFNLDHAWNNEWVRDNVLKVIYNDYYADKVSAFNFSKSTMRLILRSIGKSNVTIAIELQEFMILHLISEGIYSFNAALNWVALSWISNIKKEVREDMYCKDLKQTLDAAVSVLATRNNTSFEAMLEEVKTWNNYPQNKNEHNALADAKWNKDLFNFIGTIV